MGRYEVRTSLRKRSHRLLFWFLWALDRLWEMAVREQAKQHFVKHEGMTQEEADERVSLGQVYVKQEFFDGPEGELASCITEVRATAEIKENIS